MRIKRSFSNYWLMVRLNWGSNDVRNCKETSTLAEECEKLLNVRRKKLSIWPINKAFYLKNPKSPTSLEKCINKWGK